MLLLASPSNVAPAQTKLPQRLLAGLPVGPDRASYDEALQKLGFEVDAACRAAGDQRGNRGFACSWNPGDDENGAILPRVSAHGFLAPHYFFGFGGACFFAAGATAFGAAFFGSALGSAFTGAGGPPAAP